MSLFRKLGAVSAALLCGAIAAQGQSNIISALVAVTNAAGTTNGQTIIVNGDSRMWTNSVQSASQIFTNSTAAGAATNMFLAFADAPFSKVSMTWAASNAVNLVAAPGGAMSVALSLGWGLVTLSTNALTNAIPLRLPVTVESPANRTNLASMLAAALQYSTNALPSTAAFWTNFAAASNNLAGTFTGYLTNCQNYGTVPMASPIQNVASSEAFGIGAQALGTYSVGVGDSCISGTNAVAVGYSAWAGLNATHGTAVGSGSTVYGRDGTALGFYASAGSNAVALGQYASAAANSVVLGGPGTTNVSSPGVYAGNGGLLTNLNGAAIQAATITNAALANNLSLTGMVSHVGDVSFANYALSSLANGNNADLAVTTNTFVNVSGPTGVFTICGIANGRDGKLLILVNRTGQVMTVANDSGVDAIAANRIYTSTGAPVVAANANCSAIFIYSGSASRWILVSLQ